MFGSTVLASVMSAAVAMQSAGGGAASASFGQEPTASRVSVMTTTYMANGDMASMSINNRGTRNAFDFTLYVYTRTTPCEMTTAAEAAPTDATYGWRVNVRANALQAGASARFVQVDWQRLWEGGKTLASGPHGSVAVRLATGDRAPIDSIQTAPAEVRCAAAIMTLYVAPENGGLFGEDGALVNGVSGRGGGGGGRAAVATAQGVQDALADRAAAARVAGARGFGGTARGGRGSNNVCAPTTPEPTHGVRIQLRDSCAVAVSNFDPSVISVVGTEIWLVHTLPGGTEEVQFQKVEVAAQGKFTFPPVTAETPSGPLVVQVRGYVFAVRKADGTDGLDVGTVRSVETADRSRGLSVGTSGTHGKPIPMPAVGEVVSLEIPRETGPADYLVGHQFSLRMRVTR